MTVPLHSARGPDTAPLREAYATYFASGAYDRRYPRPNPRVLRLVRGLLPAGGHVIDYGCGSGRYLLALGDRVAVGAGYDICPTALARLREGIARRPPWGLVQAIGPDPEALAAHVARHGPADVVLCLFGVLSHVEGRAARRRLLLAIAGMLKPGTGRLVLSVPNRRRRFRGVQRSLPAGTEEIRYVRRFDGGAVELPYRLFDPESLAEELAGAGFELERLVAESLLPETAVARGRLARGVERVAGGLLPAVWGYGLLGVARPYGGHG